MQILFKYENVKDNYGMLLYKEDGVLYGISGSLSLIKDYKFFATKLNRKQDIAFCLSQIYKINQKKDIDNFVKIIMTEFHECVLP